jgi:hypothetical protein
MTEHLARLMLEASPTTERRLTMAVDLEKANNMRRVAFLLVAVLGLSGSAARIASASGEAAGKPASISSASPIYGVTIPPGTAIGK